MPGAHGDLFGTGLASLWDMAYATYKSVAVSPVQSTLTPCIFDDDPAERDSLTHLISDMGYEAVSTPDAEEALPGGVCQHPSGPSRSV
ncbi:MAG TPA: response regulator [Candidatus Acidoferrum sp.]|nr:response regulator [Candidatus Acidoferrum sp.]